MKAEKKKFLKKALTTAFLTSVVLPLLSPFTNLSNSNEVVFAETPTPDTEKKLIAAPGFFTKQFSVDMGNCKYHQKKAKEFKEAEQENIKKADGYNEKLEDSFDESEKSKGRETKAVNELMGSAADAVISSEDSKQPDKGIFGLGCGQFNILSWMTRLEEPVNITHSSVIMSLVYKFQIVALGIGVLLVAIFGMYYAMGNETTDPVRFLIRGFFTLWFVYYLPYFAQDILNINNMLTYWILTDSVPSSGVANAASVGLSGALITLVGSTNIIISAWGTAMAFGSIGAGLMFIGLLIFIVVIGFLVKQLVTMLFWWYSRLIMIIFLVMLGPLFMIMMILPKTASYGQKWIRFFVGEVFTQTSIAIGLYFASYILGNLGTLHAEVKMGLFGDTILLYGIYLLLARIPQISKNQIGGADIGGLNFGDAQQVGKTFGDFVQKAGFAIAGNYARGKITEKYQPDRDRRAELARKEKQNDITDEEQAELNHLTDKLANIERREEFGNRMGTAMLNGSFKQAMGDIGEIRRKADEKAKAKFGAEDVYADGKSYGKKLLGDSDNSLKEAEKDIEKAKDEEFNKFQNAMKRIDNNEQKAKERGEHTPEEFDRQRAAEEKKYNSALGEINSRDPENEARKIREKSREHLEKMAEGMVGNGFDNQMERRAAISRKADELEKMLRGEMKEEAIQKAAERKEAQGKVGIGANQLAQVMNTGVNALSEKLQEQGMSKEQADANAAQALQKSSQLDEIKKENRKLLKTHEQNPKDIKGKELEKLTGVLSNIGKLESEINDLTGNVPSKQVAEAFNGSVGAVSNLLQEKGNLSAEEAMKRAKEIVPKQLEANSLSSQLPKNNENLTDEQKQKKEDLAKTMSEISKLSGGVSNDAIQKATNSGFQGITESLKKQGHSQETAQVQATNLGQLHNKIESLKNENSEILSLNNSDLTKDEMKQKQGVISEISSLQSSMAKQGGGLNTSGVQKTLEPHMGAINTAKEDYNNLIQNNKDALGKSATEFGETALAAAVINNNGGMNSIINNTSGGGTQAVTQYLEGMGVGQSSVNIAKGIEALGQIQSMVGNTGDENSKVFAQHLNAMENGEVTPEVLQSVQDIGGIQTAMNTSLQSATPNKAQFAEVVAPLLNNVEAPVAQSVISTLWDGVSKDSSMNASVASRTTQALGDSPASYIQQIASGNINSQAVIESFENSAVPNAGEAGRVLVESAPEITETLTFTLNSESPDGNLFRGDVAATLVTGGMDSKVANSVAGSMWTDAASKIDMDSRFDNSWESTSTVIEQLASPEADVEVIVNAMTESMEQNAIPDAKGTAIAMRDNAEKIKEVIQVTVTADKPSMETAKTKLTGILLNGVEDKDAKKARNSLINSILKDITQKMTGNKKPDQKSLLEKDKENK
ncbi:hypothetical protein COA01_23335 [Bacillus cereus]|uniref:type IV secretion system protein n=1 Tax=Bacillus cereus TaxID=1396 RepID=UPI000BFDF82D|nr:type IV secretion system protein [Bacillus cereus]PGP18679.1 hypothetical protein COA01_23335 [Bacillus cereus]